MGFATNAPGSDRPHSPGNALGDSPNIGHPDTTPPPCLFPPRRSNPTPPPSRPPIAPSRCLHFIPAPVFPSRHSPPDAPLAWLLFCRFPCPSFRFLFGVGWAGVKILVSFPPRGCFYPKT